MVKLENALDLESSGRNVLGVRSPLWAEMIKEGMVVRLFKGPRIKYFSSFEKWIDEHEDRHFYVERILIVNDGGGVSHNSVKLSKVGFWISEDFLE